MQLPAHGDASVVICAYTDERWADLLAAIESAMRQLPAPLEVLVVVDHAADLAARLRAAAPVGVRVLENEGPRGLSGARNTGTDAARGNIVAFLDDDARAEPGWLSGLLEPFADRTVVGAGGAIEPDWDGARPRWLLPELDWIVGCTYRGMAAAGADIRNPIGASMAFRRDALVAAGGFHSSVGRGRSLPVGGEETELAIRLRRLRPDARIVYVPGSRARHRVPAARASFRYALVRSFAEGVTKAHVARLQGSAQGLSTERRYVVRTLPAAAARELLGVMTTRSVDRLLRAGTIVVALAAAAAGFVAGTLRGPRTPSAGRRGDRLRILQVTPRFPPFTGGVETHTDEVARRLAARGHAVTVATTDPARTLPQHERRDGVEIRRVAAWPRNRDWYAAPGLLPLVLRGDWDVVHVQGVHTLVPFVAALAALVRRRPFVLTFHSGGHSSRVRTSLRPLQWAVLAPFLRRASALVAVSRFERDRFSSLLGVDVRRFRVIPNGSDLPPAAEPTHDAAGALDADETDGTRVSGSRVDAGDPLLVSVGRLERYKGHHRVIAALPAIAERRPGARLVIAGGGPYEAELRLMAERLDVSDRVSIGPVARRDLGRLLDSADLVLLLSDYEAHPVAVMEALARGRRVLVAATSGLAELAERGLVRAIDVDSPPLAVARAVEEELDRAPIVQRPRLPTWDDTADAVEAVYRQVTVA